MIDVNRIIKFTLLILTTVMTLSVSTGAAQGSKQSHRAIPISDILPFYDFELIREYVLANGDRKNYCVNYRNMPYLKIDDTDIELYFISFAKDKVAEPDDYAVMYLVAKFNGRAFNFYIFMGDDAKVYLYDYNDTFSNEDLEEKAIAELRQKIPLVLNLLR